MGKSISTRFLLVALVVGALPTLFGFGQQALISLRSEREERLQALDNLLRDRKTILEHQTEKFRQILLTTAQNPAFRRYFEASAPEEREVWRREMEQAVGFLSLTFPGMVDEACSIASGGAELARVTRGEPAPPEDLSPDESEAIFFRPTMESSPGEVTAAGPYVSPDSQRPVMAFATPLVSERGEKLGVLHMEVPLAYFRERLGGEDLPPGYLLLVTDRGGRVVVRSDQPVPQEGNFSPFSSLFTVSGNSSSGGVTGAWREGRRWLIQSQELPELGLTLHLARQDDWTEILLRRLVSPALVALAVLAFTLAVARFLVRRNLAPLLRLTRASQALRKGRIEEARELSSFRSADEVGELAEVFRDLVERFHALLDRLKSTGTALTASHQNLLEAVAHTRRAVEETEKQTELLAANAEVQARAMEETEKHLKETGSSIEKVRAETGKQAAAAQEVESVLGSLLEKTRAASELASRVRGETEEAERKAREGTQVLGEILDHVAEAEKGAQAAAREVEELSQASAKIAELTSTIGQVAQQTNLLALNAAIEAARAGHLGHGFAVVAEEVRRLAEQAREAAEEITAVTDEIRLRVEAARETLQESARTVSFTAGKAQVAREHLFRISGSVTETARQMSAMAEEMAEVEEAVRAARQSFRGLAALAEETSSTAGHMAALEREVEELAARVTELSRQNWQGARRVLATQQEVAATAGETEAQAQSLAEAARTLEALISEYEQ